MKEKKIKGQIQTYPAVDSPPVDPFESIVATYFQLKGYITSMGKWFWMWDIDKHQPGYQDIDVLAINESKTVIISVTSNLDDKVAFKKNGKVDKEKWEKLMRFFERAQRYLTKTPQYCWLVQEGRSVEKLVVCANWHKKNLMRIRDLLDDEQIKLKTSSEIFDDLQKDLMSVKKQGLKTNEPIIRFLKLWMKRGPHSG